MKKIEEIIIKHYKYVLVVFLIVTVPLGYFFTKQKFVNHVDVFFEKDSPKLNAYKEFKKRYGNEETVVVAFKDDNLFSNEKIKIIRDITEKLELSTGVQRVFSLTKAEKAIGNDDSINFKKIIPKGKLSTGTLRKIRESALAYDPIINSLISKDGKTAAIQVELESFKDNKKKTAALQNIIKTAESIVGDSVELHFAGLPFLEAELNTLSERDFTIFIPIILLVIVLVVFLMLKNFVISALCLLNLLFILVWGIGFLTFNKESFDVVSSVMSPILLAVSVAATVHILAHYKEIYQSNGGDHKGAVVESVRSLWLPCLLTSLTTGAGFFSFVASSIRPVKILGLYTSAGVIFSFFFAVLFLPSILMLFKSRFSKDKYYLKLNPEGVLREQPEDDEGIISKFLLGLGNLSIKHYRLTGIALVIVLIAGIAGIYQISFKTNLINFLPDSSRAKNDNVFIVDEVGGAVPFILLVKAKSEEHNFDKPESLKIIDDAQNKLFKSIEQFSKVYSIADYYKEINMAFNNNSNEFFKIPEFENDIRDFFEIGDPLVIDRIISPDKMEARITAFSRWDSNEVAKDIKTRICNYMDKAIGDKYEYNITGIANLYLDMQENLKYSQINSFLIAFIIIFIMMFFVCRNIKLTFISIIPNLFPIVMILGIMGWSGIALDVSTIMIASITIGVAVDDTIHFIVWFKRNVLSGLDTKSALLKTYKDAGKPISITTLILFLSFFVFVFGSIKPTQAFGVLTAFSMVFALIGDLIVFPAVILIFKPKITD